jgi:hypothetical protein
MTLNIPGFSTNGLLMMLGGIKQSLAVDDNTPGQDKIYGVRIFPDWKQMASAIELELQSRKVKFEPVSW